jgi:RNA polymerase sigma-70 factor (ECF subfamily)
MLEPQTFQDLLRRVRAGEAQAAEELVKAVEPAIRRIVRVRLVDVRLRRVLDSMDICQSVLCSFFTRAALGQYQLETPEQLLKLLAAMTRHKLADQVDHEQAGRRDNRRVVDSGTAPDRLAAPPSDPSHPVEAQELLAEVRRRLPEEELQLLELRNQGHEWTAIAESLGGGTPEALRKRLSRAIDRVVQQLNL